MRDQLKPDRLRDAMADWKNPKTGGTGIACEHLGALLYLHGHAPGVVQKERVAAYLQGTINPYGRVFIGLADVLGVSVAWLCGEGDDDAS